VARHPFAYVLDRFVEVNLAHHLPAYDEPQAVAEWRWIEANASFKHVGNNTEPGVWEFVLNLSNEFCDVPPLLAPILERAREDGASYIIFHQG
jgi:hypothetical protein